MRDTKARFPLIAFDAIKLDTRPKYLVRGLIAARGLNVIWGPPKSGKSFWALDILMHVALGWPYRGRRVQQGAVVYISLEGASGFTARAAAWGIEHLDAYEGRVPFFALTASLDLIKDHTALVAEVRAQVPEGEEIVAVCFDTLNRSLAGSESSDQDMSNYVRACDAVRDALDCAVLVVHHCGHDQNRPRGHSSLMGAADAQIAISRDAADQIIASVELMKDGPIGEQVVSRLRIVAVGEDDLGDPIESGVIEAVEGQPVLRAEKVRQPKLNADATMVLQEIGRAHDEGQTEPVPIAAPGLKPGPRGIEIKNLRERVYQRGFKAATRPDDDADKKTRDRWADARLKAFNRAVDRLIEARKVRQEGDWLILL